MLSVVLVVLKITGIVLLSILGLVLFILLLVLAVPIRYRADAQKSENISAEAHATWLLSLVHYILSFDGQCLETRLKVLGISVKHDKKTIGRDKTDDDAEDSDDIWPDDEELDEIEEKPSHKDKGESKEENAGVKADSKAEAEEKLEEKTKTEAKTETEVKTEAKTEAKAEPDSEAKAEDKAETKNEAKAEDKKDTKTENKTDNDKPVDESDDKPDDKSDEKASDADEGFLDRISRKKTEVEESLRNKYNKIKHYVDTVRDARFKNGVKYALNRAFAIIKHIIPRKLKLNAHYGFEDPSTTGYITAAVGALYGHLENSVVVNPDFENEVLEGSAKLSGHVRLGTVVFILLQVVLKRDCRFVYKTIKAEGNK